MVCHLQPPWLILLARMFVYDPPQGVIAAFGGKDGGWSFYILHHKLHFAVNILGVSWVVVHANSLLEGYDIQVFFYCIVLPIQAVAELERTASGGNIKIYVNDVLEGSTSIHDFLPDLRV